MIVPFGILGFVSLPVVGHLALGSLEWCYPPQDNVADDAGAIVVLSGYVRPPSDNGSGSRVGVGHAFAVPARGATLQGATPPDACQRRESGAEHSGANASPGDA